MAKHICVDKSNVARQLAYLEKEGFVERRQSPSDGRVILVYPTQKAFDVLPEVKRVTAFWNEYITQDLTKEEKESLSGVLEKIVCRARSYFEESGEEK